MHWDITFLTGGLFAVSFFLLLQQEVHRIVLGFGVMTNAANLMILATAREPTFAAPPIVTGTSGTFVDPIPQALILTMIVIGFGLTAFLVFYYYRLLIEQEEG